jgi:hemolysin D
MSAPQRVSALPSPPVKRSDFEFLAPAIEVLETPPSPVRMALILTICAFASAALIWSYFGHVDIIAAAQGKIQPTGRVKVVQPLVNGKVKTLPPPSGTSVKQGDILLELDPADALVEEADAKKALSSTRAETQRRKAAVEFVRANGDKIAIPRIRWEDGITDDAQRREQAILDGDLEQLKATSEALDAKVRQKTVEIERLEITIAAQNSLVATLQQRVDMRSVLASRDAGTLANVLDATENLKEQQIQLALLEARLADANAALEVLNTEEAKALKSFISDQLQRLGEAERRADELEQRLARARNLRNQMILRSPVDGTVQLSSVTGVGQVVTVGQDILRVIPEADTLELEVYVRNKDIGFIQVGQEAVVKIEAFPFTRYGTVPATVKKIAKDAIPEPDAVRREGDPTFRESGALFGGAERLQNLVFPVTLQLGKEAVVTDGDLTPLSAGMGVVAEIVTGKRRIADYIYAPISESISTAFHER